MNPFIKSGFLSTCVFFFIIASPASSMATSHNSRVVKGAYWPSWALSSFPPSAIDTSLFSHIYYAFLAPNGGNFTFIIDVSTAPLLLNFTSTLHSKKPPVKTLFSIGGGGADSALFARMASAASSRRNFILSSIEVARKFGFDGIDLDWEHPRSPKEMDDLGLLLEEWRAEIQKEAPTTGRPALLLTQATYFAADFFLDRVYRKYPVASLNKNLDWVNAMCYDYHGSWDTTATGAPAALFDPKSNISSSYGLNKWISAGLSRKKLIMGLPLYGRSWRLRDPRSSGIGAAAVGIGPGDEQGTMTFSAIEQYNKDNKARVVFDAPTVSVYSVAGTAWIGYDDPRSTAVKVGYAHFLGLRGYFFWAVNGDRDWKISRRASESWIGS